MGKPLKRKGHRTAVVSAPRRKPSAEHLKPYRFKPGAEWTGNAGGRPKDDLSAQIARGVFIKDPARIEKALFKALLKGSARLFVALSDRGFGKVPQPIEVPGLENVSEALLEAWERLRRAK